MVHLHRTLFRISQDISTKMTDTQFKHMNVAELETVISDQAHIIVDIRDATSFANGHIPGSIHLTNENIQEFIRETDLDAPTVVVCYHGNSSQQAAQFLVSQDFSDVFSLDGGFVGWQTSFPTQVNQNL